MPTRGEAGSPAVRKAVRGRALSRFMVAFLAAISLLLVIAGPAQGAAVGISGLTVELWENSSGGHYWSSTRHGWRYEVEATSLTVVASQPVSRVIRCYLQNDGIWALGSGNPPMNGYSGALEVNFLDVPQEEDGGVYTVTGYLHGYEYTDPAPYNQHPAEGSGWGTWYGGFWLIVYQSGDYDCLGNDGSALGEPPSCNYTDDPINTSTGNATLSVMDLVLPGKGLGLAFTRTYNSRNASTEEAVGYGWSYTYGTRLDLLSAGAVTLVYADGHSATFLPSSGGDYDQPEGTKEKLVKNADDTYTVTTSDQALYDFSATGRLETLTDRYGSVTTLTYDSSGLLAEVEDPGGRSFAFTYSGSCISTITDSASRTVSYGYDYSGNLVAVTDPNGNTTTYTYDAYHQLLTVSAPESAASPLVTNTYSGGQAVSQTDALGGSTTLEYEPDTDSGTTTVTDNNGNTTVDTWDPITCRLLEHQDGRGHSTFFTYNWRGWLESSTDANGNTGGLAYDENDNLTSVVDAEGHATRMGYDDKNNLLYLQSALGERLSRTSSGLLRCRRAGDRDGERHRLRDADARVHLRLQRQRSFRELDHLRL